MTLRALLLLVCFSTSASLLAADWPQWRGPKRDGKSADTNLITKWPAGKAPKIVWKIEDEELVGPGYGSMAVVGDKVFLMGSDGVKKTAAEFCSCLNAANGKLIWKKPMETTAGNFNDGWGAGPRSTPTVDGDHIYALGSTGDLVCFAAADGKEVWRVNLVNDFGGKIPVWGYSESVLIDGDKVVCTPGSNGGMVALDKKTGKVVWQCKDFKDAAGYSSIVPMEVSGVRQYVQQTMDSGLGVRAEDGKLLWKVGEIGRRTAVIPTPVVDKDNGVFFTAGYGAGCEYVKLEPDGENGTKASIVYTKNKVVGNHHGGVIEHDGKIYGHSDTGGGWVCFDYTQGDEDPIWRSTKLPKGSITYADGHFYCYAESNGTLAIIEASDEDWIETGRFQIPQLSKLRPSSGKVWPHPVIANGKLYLRDYGLIYVYDISQPGAQ